MTTTQTITVESTRFGPIEVPQNQVIEMKGPILGFANNRHFVLIEHDKDSPFYWFQSADDADLAFVLTNPKYFGIEYEFVLPPDAATKLSVSRADQVLVFTIVNIPDGDPSGMTANLLAPLVLNQETASGMQVVLNETQWGTRHYLLPQQGPADDALTDPTQPSS